MVSNLIYVITFYKIKNKAQLYNEKHSTRSLLQHTLTLKLEWKIYNFEIWKMAFE